MQLYPSPLTRLFALICFLLLPVCASELQATTVQELENTADLTPAAFAHFFSGFEFKFHNEVQSPEAFLATQSGDCDDYAILAARVLKLHGYTPRLITVRMPRVVHVVCYVEETNSYLDYNYRSSASGTIECRPEVAEIARSVAKSYGLKWSSASEFTFESGTKRLVKTVLEHNSRQFASAGQ